MSSENPGTSLPTLPSSTSAGTGHKRDLSSGSSTGSQVPLEKKPKTEIEWKASSSSAEEEECSGPTGRRRQLDAPPTVQLARANWTVTTHRPVGDAVQLARNKELESDTDYGLEMLSRKQLFDDYAPANENDGSMGNEDEEMEDGDDDSDYDDSVSDDGVQEDDSEEDVSEGDDSEEDDSEVQEEFEMDPSDYEDEIWESSGEDGSDSFNDSESETEGKMDLEDGVDYSERLSAGKESNTRQGSKAPKECRSQDPDSSNSGSLPGSSSSRSSPGKERMERDGSKAPNISRQSVDSDSSELSAIPQSIRSLDLEGSIKQVDTEAGEGSIAGGSDCSDLSSIPESIRSMDLDGSKKREDSSVAGGSISGGSECSDWVPDSNSNRSLTGLESIKREDSNSPGGGSKADGSECSDLSSVPASLDLDLVSDVEFKAGSEDLAVSPSSNKSARDEAGSVASNVNGKMDWEGKYIPYHPAVSWQREFECKDPKHNSSGKERKLKGVYFDRHCKSRTTKHTEKDRRKQIRCLEENTCKQRKGFALVEDLRKHVWNIHTYAKCPLGSLVKVKGKDGGLRVYYKYCGFDIPEPVSNAANNPHEHHLRKVQHVCRRCKHHVGKHVGDYEQHLLDNPACRISAGPDAAINDVVDVNLVFKCLKDKCTVSNLPNEKAAREHLRVEHGCSFVCEICIYKRKAFGYGFPAMELQKGQTEARGRLLKHLKKAHIKPEDEPWELTVFKPIEKKIKDTLAN
ncbi:hypothetical protein BJ508DRAFT_364398 [Ascobolus immersus RN42]|uniref:Uncharacterized protein n=1 Tax=Ascobolus immersus RN42 TaxID=1160509 RepID=A0A3N4HUJ7_ASCIM|nr:hypothetical protein BJ508DRAFT_364398 [Ascobolus immersus RN42]